MKEQNKTVKNLFLTKFRASYKKFMGIPMNLEHENLKLLLEDAEQLIEASSTRNEIKTSLRFNKKINTNKSSCPEIEPHNKPNLRLIPNNLKTLLSFPDKFCKCHKIRLTVNGIFNHFEY